MSEGLRVEPDGPVTTVTLDRPERLNALSYSVIRGLRATLDELRDDPAQRVVVLAGAGGAFSAGIDLKEQAAGAVWDERAGRVQERYALQQAVADLVAGLRRIPQPVIAVVTGVAAGGGLSLACAADIRIAEPAARFSAAFVRIGASGGDMGRSYFLPRIVGWDLAAELLYTGRTVDAAEAERIGLVTQLVPAGEGLAAARPEFYEVMMACARIGAVFVPFNIRLSAGEISYMAEDAGLSLLICEAFFADRLPAAAGPLYWLDPPEGERSYADLAGAPVRTADGVTADHTLVLAYTSGTTGRPKAAMITHGNAAATSIAVINADGIGPSDRVIQPAPLAFAGSMLAISMPMLHAGASMVIERDVTPERLLDLVDHGGVTMLKLVPVFYQPMAASPAFGGCDLSRLRTATFGGAPAALELLQLYQARGVGLSSAYGLTEGGYNLGLPAEDAFEWVGWAGLPLPFQRCQVVGEDGRSLPPGEVGELVIAGPCVMRGYWSDPAATAAVLRDGWLHTGDLAVCSERGYYKIVDRKKDMIISGGLNVYPAEVERVLSAHPSVVEVAVVGVPDSRWGETPLACVVSRDPALTLAALAEFAAGELADYKRPRRLRLLAELPRNSNGKVIKQQLRSLGSEP